MNNNEKKIIQTITGVNNAASKNVLINYETLS
jgi:hypothetical protein